MPRSEASSLLGDYHRIGGVATPRGGSSYGSSDAATPRSPFDTGFPMMFNSPVPSPRPHRLSFAYAKDDSNHNRHVFLSLLVSVVGVGGMLTIPYTFLLVPSGVAVLGIVLVGFSMAFTAAALLNTHVALSQEQEEMQHIGAGKRFTSFQSIAVLAGGNLFGYLVSVVTAVGIYGGCVGSIRIIRDISPFLLAELYALLVTSETKLSVATSLQWADYFLCGTFIVIVFPLCLLKNLSALRMSSYFGFAFSIYVVLAIIYRSSHHALEATGTALHSNSNDTANAIANAVATNSTGELFGSLTAALSATVKDSAERVVDKTVATTVIVGGPLSQSLSIYNYAFMMHLNLLPLFIQLRGSFAEPLQKSRRKMSDYILGVTVFCVFLYLVLGLFAKKLFGPKIRGNVLLNLENDPVMEIPLVAVYLTAIASFPLLFQPLRSVLEELIYSTSVSEIPFATRLGGTSFLLLSQLLLAIIVPGIEVVFAFTGATSCVLICYLFPAVMYTQLFPWRTARGGKLWVVALWILVAIFSVVGGIAMWFLVVDLRRH